MQVHVHNFSKRKSVSLFCCICWLDIRKVLHDLKETSLHSVDIPKHFVVCMYVGTVSCYVHTLYLMLSILKFLPAA